MSNITLDKVILNAENELSNRDKVMKDLIQLNGHLTYKPGTDYFSALCRSIVGQQISVAAASTIFSRLQKATVLSPNSFKSLTNQQAKDIGLSRQKYAYIKDLATHFIENPNIYDNLDALSDDDIIAELSKVNGMGVWTAQMFLMFTLIRLDVFAIADAGIKRAIERNYLANESISKDKMLEISIKWRPYRTVACWHLWKSLNNAPNS